jgi:histone acetyltransferase (RNA polymerase elongator complex component)
MKAATNSAGVDQPQAGRGRSRPLVIPIFLPHAGCPHRCVYCNQYAAGGGDTATPSDQALHGQIESYLACRNPRRDRVQIAFFGGNFLGLPEETVRRYLSVAVPYVRSGRVDGLRFSTRPDTLDRRRLRLIAPYPVQTVEVGAQSLCDEVLVAAGREHTAEDTVRAVGRLHAHGYEVGIQLMVGLPADDGTRSLATARRAVALRPHFVRIYPTLVLENTPLAKRYRRGVYRPLTLQAAVEQVASLYRCFAQAGIPVVRMGLQASADGRLESAVLAGPHHPAFGHLVLSEVFLGRAAAILSRGSRSRGIRIYVHPRDVSRMRGQNNRNLELLKERFALAALAVKADKRLSVGCIRIEESGRLTWPT